MSLRGVTLGYKKPYLDDSIHSQSFLAHYKVSQKPQQPYQNLLRSTTLNPQKSLLFSHVQEPQRRNPHLQG